MAREFVRTVYAITEVLRRKEGRKMTDVPSQIRWSGGAVPGSIAEGCVRTHAKETVNVFDAYLGVLAKSKRPLIDGGKAGYVYELSCKKLKALSEGMPNGIVQSTQRCL